MIRNFFIASFRNLIKNKIYTVINVSGLTIGIAATLFILIFVYHESKYDSQFNSGDKIYRLIRGYDKDDGVRDIGITSAPFAPALLNDFPGRIKEALRISSTNALVKYGELKFMENKIFMADSNFFHFFNLPLLKGSPERALEGSSILISSAMAKKYFGTEDPVNKILELDNQFLFTITGVFDETRIQSHLDFDFLASLHYNQRFSYFSDWWSNDFSTYFMLEEGAGIEQITTGLPAFTEKYFGNDWKRGVGLGLYLKAEPLHEIYFNNESTFDFVLHGNKKVVYLFSAVAVLVLLIAVFNFVNLSTALSVSRHVEIGIRKTSGAGRGQIMVQFLMESVLLVFAATMLAFLVLETLYPWFLSVVGKQINNPLTIPVRLIILVVLSLFLGTLSGLYPALILSAFNPHKVLAKKHNAGPRGQLLRKSMVILQFTFSLFLILATWITWEQLQFVQKKDLGFSYDKALFFKLSNIDIYNNRNLFKQRCLQLPEVEHVTFSSGEPGGFHDFNVFKAEDLEGTISLRTVFTDFDYVPTLGLNLIAGRNFNRDFRTDSAEAVIINKEAAKVLGWTPEEALGKTIQNVFRDSEPRRVVGVVEDYHFRSLKEKINPLVIAINNDHRVGIIKFNTGNMPDLLESVSKEWDQLANDYPFAYNFLDDQIGQLYSDEKNQSKLFLIFCSLAIFIACMGLFALSMILASKRMKEMAIRKVHGASLGQIMGILNWEFITLALAGTLLMIPFGYYVMDRWLQNFEYHIKISPYYFLGTALLVAIISTLTVSYKAFAVAKVNPANALRYE